MRLLEIGDDGSLTFTGDIMDPEIPPYAVLSHTWGKATDEVLYQDVLSDSGTAKIGFRKIQYCAEQASKDDIRHIWVDTCCIDKTNSVELSEAINSMFKWFAKAERCYVYLQDLPWKYHQDGRNESLEMSIRNSRWFTRGWTLQELLAPKTVIFYSAEWVKLGDKESLERLIADVTRIPAKALQNTSLEEFSIPERQSWQDNRLTTRDEDLAYALFGICGVHLPLIYGEGRKSAFARLNEAIGNPEAGKNRNDFSITFALNDVVGVEKFVARSNELRDMRAHLSSDSSHRAVILHGLGGIGKTQLAIAFAKRHRNDYSAIFWINAKDENSLKSSFASIASQISIQHPSALKLDNVSMTDNVDQAVAAVRAWLSLPGNTRWLMLFDNLDNPKLPGNTDPTSVDIRNFLPQAHQGYVVVTTRSTRLDIGLLMNVKKMSDMNDSLQILSDSSRRLNLDSDPDAVKLAEKLDGLPLALATAGAFLYQSTVTFAEYLDWHESAWATLQRTSPGPFSYEDRMLYSTWQVSYDQVKAKNPSAANLLCLWAYFDNQDLWYELLLSGEQNELHPSGLEWVSELVENALRFHNTVRVLCDHGLVEPETSSAVCDESGGYSVHTCVHAWTKTVLNTGWNLVEAGFALRCVASHPLVDQHRRVRRRLLKHASCCLHDHWPDDTTGLQGPFRNLASLYCSQGMHAEEVRLFKRALNGENPTETGSLHTRDTLDTSSRLGQAYIHLYKFAEADEILEGTLSACESVFGIHDQITINNAAHLGYSYRHQGKLVEAENVLHRALCGDENGQDPENDEGLRTSNELSFIYAKQGDFEKAEKVRQRVLTEGVMTQKSYALTELGNVYRDQGRLDKAEEMGRRALRRDEILYGPDGEDTLASTHFLGCTLGKQGKFEEAEAMLQRALQGYENLFGLEDRRTLQYPLLSLAILYREQGRLHEAERMFRRQLQGFETLSGPVSVQTIVAANDLGDVLQNQSRFEEAEAMLQRALQGGEHLFGPVGMFTLYPVLNLGMLYLRREKLDEAEKMYKRGLQERDKMKPDWQAEFLELEEGLQQARKEHTDRLSSQALQSTAQDDRPSRRNVQSRPEESGTDSACEQDEPFVVTASDLCEEGRPRRRGTLEKIKMVFRKRG